MLHLQSNLFLIIFSSVKRHRLFDDKNLKVRRIFERNQSFYPYDLDAQSWVLDRFNLVAFEVCYT